MAVTNSEIDVDALIAERDELRDRAVPEAARLLTKMSAAKREIEVNLDMMRKVLALRENVWAHTAFRVIMAIDGGRRTWGDPTSELPRVVAELDAERLRYREALQMIAIPPHEAIAGYMVGCEGCAAVAQAALDDSDRWAEMHPARVALGLEDPE